MTSLQTSAPSSVGFANATVSGSAWVREHKIDQPEVYFPEVAEPVIWAYVKPATSEVTVGRRHHAARPYAVCDLRLVRPGTIIRRVPKKPSTMRALHLPADTFLKYLGTPQHKVDSALDRLEQDTFRSPMIEMLTDRLSMAEKLKSPPLLKNSLAESVVFELWRITGQADPVADATWKLDQPTLNEIDEYIDSELDEKLDVNKLADVAGMSVAVFTRAFKKSTGKTPYQYIVGCRLVKARGLITGTRLSLAQIAYQCGFSSQSHMTEVFSAKLGIAPGRLRAEER